MLRRLQLLTTLTLLLPLCSCSWIVDTLLTRDKATARKQVILYGDRIKADKYDDAATMCHSKSFVWIQSDEEVGGRGKAAIAAFHASIRSIPRQQAIEVRVNPAAKIGNQYVVSGYILVKQTGARLGSVKIPVSITLKTKNGKWRIMQIKETGKRVDK